MAKLRLKAYELFVDGDKDQTYMEEILDENAGYVVGSHLYVRKDGFARIVVLEVEK